MDKAIIEQAIQMRKEGVRFKDIAAHFGVNMSTIANAIYNYDFKLKHPYYSKRSKASQYRNYLRARELYRELHRWRLVAEEMNVSTATLIVWNRKFKNIA